MTYDHMMSIAAHKEATLSKVCNIVMFSVEEKPNSLIDVFISRLFIKRKE